MELACQLWKDENFELPPEQREAPSREGWLDEFRCDALNEFSIFAGAEDERRRAKEIGCKSGAEEGRSLGALLGLAIGDALGGPLEFHPARYGSTELHTLGQEDIWGQAPTWNGKVGEGQKKEWNSAFNVKPGQWTDDTSMALCLADSLLVHRGLHLRDLRLRFLNWWHFGYNNSFRLDLERKEKISAKDGVTPIGSGQSIGLGGNIGVGLRDFMEKPEFEFTQAGDRRTSGNGSLMLCLLNFLLNPS